MIRKMSFIEYLVSEREISPSLIAQAIEDSQRSLPHPLAILVKLYPDKEESILEIISLQAQYEMSVGEVIKNFNVLSPDEWSKVLLYQRKNTQSFVACLLEKNPELKEAIVAKFEDFKIEKPMVQNEVQAPRNIDKEFYESFKVIYTNKAKQISQEFEKFERDGDVESIIKMKNLLRIQVMYTRIIKDELLERDLKRLINLVEEVIKEHHSYENGRFNMAEIINFLNQVNQKAVSY